MTYLTVLSFLEYGIRKKFYHVEISVLVYSLFFIIVDYSLRFGIDILLHWHYAIFICRPTKRLKVVYINNTIQYNAIQ